MTVSLVLLSYNWKLSLSWQLDGVYAWSCQYLCCSGRSTQRKNSCEWKHELSMAFCRSTSCKWKPLALLAVLQSSHITVVTESIKLSLTFYSGNSCDWTPEPAFLDLLRSPGIDSQPLTFTITGSEPCTFCKVTIAADVLSWTFYSGSSCGWTPWTFCKVTKAAYVLFWTFYSGKSCY